MLVTTDAAPRRAAGDSPRDAAQFGVAYILKGFPRTSETFITNEIYLIERLGLPLRVFSLLRLTGQQRHAVAEQIQTAPEYLPETSSLEEDGLPRWLRANLAKFAPSHARLFAARPAAYAATLVEAVRCCFRFRAQGSRRPNRQFIKEFLQAGDIAARVMEDQRIRHLHAHFAHTCTTVAMFASRLTGLPFSFTAHAKDIYLGSLNPGDLLRVKMERARFVVTCTQANQRHLATITNRTPIHTIYHGLDTARFTRYETPVNTGPPLILSVGRFVEKKGFTYLVEACALLRQRGYEFQCRIIGGGDGYLERVKALIRDRELEGVVETHPAVTQEALIEILKQGTLFALPCQIIESGDRDGIPNVLVEAMASGLPVVSSNISGIPELIADDVNGLLVPQRDAEALAAAIERLLNDVGLRARLGAAGRETVCRDFDSRRNVQALYRLFAESLKAEVRA